MKAKMKKIKNMKHLKAEKKKLKRRQEELEARFGNDWHELKETLHPKRVAGDVLQSWMNKKTNDFATRKNILQSTLSYGASLLAKRFAEKAGEKIDSLFKRP
jgi:hypothetical protein